MKVKNMVSSKGKKVANQFIITEDLNFSSNVEPRVVFQSYESVIATISGYRDTKQTYLDKEKWNYSKTTSKYRNQFLGETTKETKAKIDSGEYILTDLN